MFTPKLLENKLFIEDPSSFINLLLRKLIKTGKINSALKMIYKLLLLIRNKGIENSPLLIIENLIKSSRMYLRVINFKLRGKQQLVPGISSVTFARNELIKNLVKPANLTKSNLKEILNFLLTETANLKTNSSLIKKQSYTNNTIVRKETYLAKKIFAANKQQEIFKNANTSKKKFFHYI